MRFRFLLAVFLAVPASQLYAQTTTPIPANNLPLFTQTTPGVVAAPGSSTGRFLRDDGAWTALGTAAAVNTGTSGATIPLLNAANTWSSTMSLTPSTGLYGLFIQTPTGTTQGFNVYTPLGSGILPTNANYNYNQINIVDDEIYTQPNLSRDAMTQGLFVGLVRNKTSGVPAGGMQAIQSYAELANPTSAANRNRNYVGGTFSVQSDKGDGGTATTLSATAHVGDASVTVTNAANISNGDVLVIMADSGQWVKYTVSGAPSGNVVTLATTVAAQATSGNAVYDPKGAFFGFNPVVFGLSTSTNTLEMTGGEVNTYMPAGSSTWYKGGLTIVQVQGDSVQGSVIDCGLCLSNQSNAVGWKTGIQFGAQNGTFPIPASGGLFSVDLTTPTTPTIAYGIDISKAGITGAAFKFANGAWYGNGNMALGSTAVPTDTVDINGNMGFVGSTNRIIWFRTGSDASSVLNYDFSDTTSASTDQVRFFRNTRAQTNSSLQVYKGDNTATVQTQFATQNTSFINAVAGNVAIGGTTASALLEVHGTALIDSTLTAPTLVLTSTGSTGDVSAMSTTATGSTTALSLGVRQAEILNVMDYGAKCDSSTDDSTAFNAVFTRVRSLIATNIMGAVVVKLPPTIPNSDGSTNFRRCIINSTINATGIYSTVGNALNVTFEGNGTAIYGRMAGTPVIDALGSNQIIWHNLHIISDNTFVPSYGIQIGRTDTTLTDHGGGAGMRFDDLEIVGYFSTAGLYNFAGEEVTFIRPRVVNSYNSANAYAYIEDGYNHFNITSGFVTQLATVDTAQSFEETNIYGGSFQGNGASMVSPVWIGNATQHRWHNVYVYGGGGSTSCVTLYNAANGIYQGIKELDLDIHCEGSALTNQILITGTLTSPTVRSLKLTEGYEFATGSIFKLGGSVTTASLENAKVSITGGPASPAFTMFDTPTNYGIVGGDFYAYAASIYGTGGVLSLGTSVFSGRASAPSSSYQAASMTCAAPANAALGGTRAFQGAVSCTTALQGSTSGSSAIRLTTDGASAGAGNCVNLPQPYGSIAVTKVSVVARDRTTTSNTVTWADWPMTYGSASNAATTVVVAGTKPTPISTGTVTGTDISVIQDTTNACMNLSWTPPSGNTDLWDVAASVSFTQVR
jgi:hypothetical protein